MDATQVNPKLHTTNFQAKMEALPERLEVMAGWARLELLQPEAEQVSLIRLAVMLSHFIKDAQSRAQRRQELAALALSKVGKA